MTYVPEWIRQRSALWSNMVQDGGDAAKDEADALARENEMPVCAEDCMDGALMLRVADYWCVPLDALHTANFCRAWFALSDETRAELLQARQMKEPEEPEKEVLVDPVLSAASLTAAAIALDDVALLKTIPYADILQSAEVLPVEEGYSNPLCGIQRMCLRHDALECIKIMGIPFGTYTGIHPAARAGAVKILQHMLKFDRGLLIGTGPRLEHLLTKVIIGSPRSTSMLDCVLDVFAEKFEFLLAHPKTLILAAVMGDDWDAFHWFLRKRAAVYANKPYFPSDLLSDLVCSYSTERIARLQQEIGCGWFMRSSLETVVGGMSVCELAVHYDRPSVLAWAKKNGCPWDEDKLLSIADDADHSLRSVIRKLNKKDADQLQTILDNTQSTAKKRKRSREFVRWV